MIPTPDTSHVRQSPFVGHVYEPAEDTFLLLDALENDKTLLDARNVSLCLEIGFVLVCC